MSDTNAIAGIFILLVGGFFSVIFALVSIYGKLHEILKELRGQP